MMDILNRFMDVAGVFFFIYLAIYASFQFMAVTVGAYNLAKKNWTRKIKNELKHEYYFPVSILVPTYNEEVTIIDNVKSLLNLDYKLYEIIVVDDGSTDNTAKVLTEHFNMQRVDRPIRRVIECQPHDAVYEAPDTRVKLTLIRKKNGGKGDALNMGINASQYPYFICIDADSMLQRDSLERIVQPVLEEDDVVAVGGLVRVAQCVEMKDGVVKSYHLPKWDLVTIMQVMEYDRSFLASRILLDTFNGNLIISGAFGLFKKDIVIAAGGYDTNTLGEDMELVVKLHMFCRNNKRNYSIRYEPNAICWSQTPGSLKDLHTQRRRWHLGLFQSMSKAREMFLNPRYGWVGSISYIYYLFYELLSPAIELLGLFTTIVALCAGVLNATFMFKLYLLYALYGAILTITAFFQRIYTQSIKLELLDIFKACIMCVLENLFFRFFLDYVRITAFIGYKKRKNQWGQIKRQKQR